MNLPGLLISCAISIAFLTVLWLRLLLRVATPSTAQLLGLSVVACCYAVLTCAALMAGVSRLPGLPGRDRADFELFHVEHGGRR